MKRKKMNLLERFVISYIIVLTLVFFVTGAFYFSTSIRLVRDETLMSGQNILEDGRNAIDNKLGALLSLSVPLISRDNVLDAAYLTRPFPAHSSITFTEIKQRLSAYAMMNDFADTLTLYYRNNKLFISNRSSGIYYDAYFDAWMEHYGMSYEEWNEMLADNSRRSIVSGYRKDGAMMMDIINRLPSSSKYPVHMIVTIDGKAFGRFFKQFSQYSGSFICVAGSGGEIYYSNTDLQTAKMLMETEESNDYLIFRTQSNEIDLEYVAFIPQKLLYRHEYIIVRDFIIIYLLLVIISIFLFIFMSYQNILPLKRVLENIARKQGVHIGSGGSEAEFIGSTFSDLMYDAENLALSIRENFLSKLLNGAAITESEIHSLDAKSAEIFNYEQYQVAALKFDRKPGEEIYEPLDIISGILPENVFPHMPDYNKIILIFCYGHGFSLENTEETLNKCIEGLGTENGKISCTVGDIKELSDQICISYQNANWLLRTADTAGGALIQWYTGFALDSEGFCYPEEARRRLANLILAGEAHSSMEEITNLYEINFNIKSLTDREKGYFTDALIYDFVILKKTIGPLNAESEDNFHYIMTLIRKNLYQESNMSYFIILSKLLAGQAEGRKNSREKALLERIINYVGDNFGDPELCLSTVAGFLGMTESYVSTFFKQGTGENISAYIENIRMHNAVRYISEDKLAIKEIAEKVGYSNLNTFYKAFKRRFGVPPKTYQQNSKMSPV